MRFVIHLYLALFLLACPARAEYAIGYLHLQNREPEKAYREFRELAEVGYSFYMNMIADMHLKGIGVPADKVLAYVWYSLSAAQQDEQGIRFKQQIEKTLDQQQLTESSKLIEEYASLYLEPLVSGWEIK